MSSAPTRSEQLYQRALRVLPGGVSRNAVVMSPHPIYAARGEGCHVTDIEGVRRVDFVNNMASLIHGHANPQVIAAVMEQLHRGTAFAMATEVEVSYAEYLCGRSPSFDKIRFVNSGTEAVMTCLKMARAFTGRPKIAKVEGAYHGIYDYAEVSQTAAPATWGEADHPASVPVAVGTPRGVLDDVVVIPFNDPARALELLDEHSSEIACVLVDPLPHRVGMMPASQDFVGALHRWARDAGALLVFDEVITFRSEYGGAQEWYGVRPDLTAMGKMIGGGFPVGAVAGRADVMDVLNPLAPKVLVPHSGTFSANPVTLTAGMAAMELFDREAVARLNALGDRARRQIAEAIAEADVPACVTGAGSMFRIHMKPEPPADYRGAFAGPLEARMTRTVIDHLFDHGVAVVNSCSGFLSTPMTGAEIDLLAERLVAAFREARELMAVGAAT
ncbi:MAG: aspartate aminotransferase family protein [Candidatus Sumerlaeia bacterium]|nr:aspartate aminotransferase family protein [Candidatus Sumerlaeia bacterium]